MLINTFIVDGDTSLILRQVNLPIDFSFNDTLLIARKELLKEYQKFLKDTPQSRPENFNLEIEIQETNKDNQYISMLFSLFIKNNSLEIITF